jgi:hypothetical protein
MVAWSTATDSNCSVFSFAAEIDPRAPLSEQGDSEGDFPVSPVRKRASPGKRAQFRARLFIDSGGVRR